MALFGKKKETERTTKQKAEKRVAAVTTKETKEEKREAKVTPLIAPIVGGLDLSKVLIRPHVTEKATDIAEHGNVYAFEIHDDANKAQVKLAIEKLYKVTPAKVAILVRKPKYTISRTTNRRVLKKHSLKKALVYLKKGDKIEFA